MKTLVANYTFDASEKTIEFDDYASIDLERIILITNVTDGIIIFNFADPSKTGTVATNVLTLEHDTSLMDDGDSLLIYYEDEDKDVFGATSDTANTDATTSGSLIAFVKGLVSMVKDVWNSVLHSLGAHLTSGIAGEDIPNDVLKVEQQGTYSYQSAAGDNKVISPDPAFLYGIIIGKDVASSIIEISDHGSDGDGNVKIHLEGSTLMTSTKGYVPVNAKFDTGICADHDNQTHVTYVYRVNGPTS